MIRTSVLLTSQSVKDMRVLGKQQGMTTSAVIRQALRLWIQREKRIARAFEPGTNGLVRTSRQAVAGE